MGNEPLTKAALDAGLADLRTSIADLRAEMYKAALALAISIISLTSGLTVALIKLLG